MHKLSLCVALAALIVSLISLVRSRENIAGAQSGDPWRQERAFPPLVFSSKATLDCSISSSSRGMQSIRTYSGQGFQFSAPMLPIKESKLVVKKPGMMYKFNAFPPAPVPASFTGLGTGTITAMKTEGEVNLKRFRQPGGPGTTITFQAGDIRPDSAYVEFTGVFVRRADGKRFPFRVVFGSVEAGSGKVEPASKQPETKIMAKSVALGTPRVQAPVTTSLYEAEDDVRPLK
jgi:hypothetical protein